MSEMEEQDNPQAPIEPHPQAEATPPPEAAAPPEVAPPSEAAPPAEAAPAPETKPPAEAKPAAEAKPPAEARPRTEGKPESRPPESREVVAPARVRRAKGRRVSIAAPSGVPSAAPIAAHAPIAVVRAPTSPPKSTSTN